MPEDTTTPEPEQQANADATGADAAPGGDDILEIIRNVETQLGQLKQARTDQEKMFQAMLEQQTELERQDHALADRSKRLDERAERIESQERLAANRAADLDHKAAELASAEEELSEQGRSLSERETTLATRERETVLQQQTFEEQFTEILEQAQKFKSEMAEFTKSRAEHAHEIKHLSAEQEKLQVSLAVVTDERDMLVSDNSRLRGELEAAQAESASDESTQNAVEKLRESLSQRDEQIQELMQRLDAVKDESSKMRDSLGDTQARDKELHDAHEELQSLREDVAESYRAAEQVEQLKAENESLRARLEADPGSSSAGELEALRERVGDTSEDVIAAADAGLRKLAELLDAPGIDPKAADALNQELATQRDRADAARTDAEELRQSLDTALAEIDRLQTSAPEQNDEGGELPEQIAKRDQVIESLTEQLKELESARQARVHALPPEEAERERRRRERLKAMRNSLRDKASRLAQANAMIDKRQDECDQILKLRSDLVLEREALEREKTEVAKGSTKSGAGVAVLCAAIAVLILAPVSWKAAEKFAPATHLASAEISIQMRDGSAVSPDHAQRFKTLMTDLLADPQVTDQAATRLARRGLDRYDSAAALSAALGERLDTGFPADHTAALSFTDAGPVQSRWTLDTYVAALVSEANSRSAARLDNTTVSVTKAPESSEAVSVAPQAVAAAGIWAASSLLSFGFFLIAAIGMTKARERIRSEEALLHSARDGSGIGWGQNGPAV